MMPPLVSILIPCYNAAPWLTATLESALAQTWPQKEIIVVNDGSTDQSLALARPFSERGVKIIEQPNRGAAAARNAALGAAGGDFVQFLDADDLLAPEKIARQMAVLTAEPKGAIASGPWGSFTDEPGHAVFHTKPVWADLTPVDWLVRSWSGGGMFPPLVWLAPRDVLAAAGPWNEALTLDDDGEYFTRVLLHAAGIRFVPGAASYYRAHTGPRISAARGERAARSSFASCESKERQLLAAENSPRVREAIGCNWQRFAWEQMAAAPGLAAMAIKHARKLAPDLPPPKGSRSYRLAAKVLGWTRARKLQLAVQELIHR